MKLSKENFPCTYVANVSVFPKLIWMNNSKISLEFKESCAKQENKARVTPSNVVNFFIVYEIGKTKY